MSSTIGTTPDTFITAREELAKLIEFRKNAGPQQPEPRPRALPWQAIKTNEEVFQHRSLTEEAAADHTLTLAKAIKRQPGTGKRGPHGPREPRLEPITVWWDGRDWICVDGHHSLAAYRLARHPNPVPVRTLRGFTLDEAIRASLKGNSKDKLPMTRRCKTEAAWRLTVAGGYSKAEIAGLAQVAKATVATMRDALRRLEAQSPGVAQRCTWAQVRHWLQHGRMPEDDDVDIETKRQQAAERTYRRIEGHIKGKSLDHWLRVLELHKPGFVAELAKAHEAAKAQWQDPDPFLLYAEGELPDDF